MSRVRHTAIAFGLVAASVGLSILIALAADLNEAVRLYSVRFAFLPGPWFGERIAASWSNPGGSCLIVGASTAREGIDPKQLERLVPRIAFYNAGTTGGNTSVLEIQAAILAHYRLHYRCIIVPIHPWLLFEKQGAVPDLTLTEYASQLDLKQLHNLSFGPLREFSNYRLLEAFLVPFRKHAPQVNRIIRNGLYRAHEKLFRDHIPRARYELYTNELQAAGDTYYHDVPFSREFVIKNLKQDHFYDPETYGHPEPPVSLERALDLFRRQTDSLVLVRMPDSTMLNVANQLALPSYQSVVAQYANRLTYLDYSAIFPDEFFLDSSHLNSRGRSQLSDLLGTTLKEVFDPFRLTEKTAQIDK